MVDLVRKAAPCQRLQREQWQLYIEGERTDNFTFAADLDSSGEVGRFRFFWDGRNAQGAELPPGIYNYAMRVRIPYTAQYCGVVGIYGNKDAAFNAYLCLHALQRLRQP